MPTDSIHVLLVEDSPSVTLQIQKLLADTPGVSFRLDHAGDLATALEMIADESIAAVILDLGLPDSEGLGSLWKMRERAPEVPIVVFTGVNDDELALEALRSGAQDYLVKRQVSGPLIVRAVRYAMERKQAEETLRESEEKHRTLLEAIPDIVYKIDPEGVIRFINESIESLGYRPEELIGKHFSVLIHPDDILNVTRDSVLPPLEGTITGPEASPKLLDERRTGIRMTKDLVMRLVPKGWEAADESACLIGSLTSYGEISAVGHYSTNTRTLARVFSGTVGIIKNITGRRRAEEERESLANQLRQSQKMEAIGRLAGGIAHDMNNVLGAIMGSASVLGMECEENASCMEDIENILVACRKGRALTRDLLGFARKGKYVKEHISLNDVVEKAKSLLVRTIDKSVKVRTLLAEDIHPVEGDRSQIHHALMNVCINAADAMLGRSGEMLITTGTVDILRKGSFPFVEAKPGRYSALSVRDSGTGMRREMISKVFEPFFTTKPKGQGTGLGLSMVYGVVKNHGGFIHIESEPGEGTEVTLLLPALDRDAKLDPDEVDQKVSIRPRREVVLLVDDELIIRNSGRRLLEKIGYSVILAEDGRRAVQVFKAMKTDISVVLLDVIMPEMGGIETYHELRSIDPDVGVLFFSGYSRNDDVEELISSGRVGFIHKPFDVAMLSSSLKEAINKRRKRKITVG